MIPFEAVELQPKDTLLKSRLLAHHEDVPQGSARDSQPGLGDQELGRRRSRAHREPAPHGEPAVKFDRCKAPPRLRMAA